MTRLVLRLAFITNERYHKINYFMHNVQYIYWQIILTSFFSSRCDNYVLFIILGPSLLVFVIIFLWNSSGRAPLHEGNFKVTGQEKQLDPVPDPAGEFCQRNKNPAGLGFIGVKYDLLRGNPEGNNALGGVDPGFDKTKKILKLTTEDGDAVPIQICYEEKQSCATAKSSKIFGGTKRYQEKLSVDVSAEGMLLAFML